MGSCRALARGSLSTEVPTAAGTRRRDVDERLTVEILDSLREKYPDKFLPEDKVFSHIHRGDRIFISTACGEPQYLVRALIEFVESHPKAFFDAEVLHVWTLGVAPYTDAKFKSNFRHNSFFISDSTREAVNEGLADYSPIFLSQVPALFRSRLVPIDVALIQISRPDASGYMSLGVSVDITKAAVEAATTVIARSTRRCRASTATRSSTSTTSTSSFTTTSRS